MGTAHLGDFPWSSELLEDSLAGSVETDRSAGHASPRGSKSRTGRLNSAISITTNDPRRLPSRLLLNTPSAVMTITEALT
jgi:hypothetical protein